MALLFFLPLLLAHPPINVQPRASVLRRMPMLFGKRDSSFTPLVSSSSVAASSPPKPYSSPPFASLDRANDFDVDVIQEWTARVNSLLQEARRRTADRTRAPEIQRLRPVLLEEPKVRQVDPDPAAFWKVLGQRGDSDGSKRGSDDNRASGVPSSRRRLRLQLLGALMSDAGRSSTDTWLDDREDFNDVGTGLGFDDRITSRSAGTDGYEVVP
ncbi:hypothetical protein BaRGS_00007394 [Batillaria attramentaria]|uniref:Uncharacterized protein n=1 Tax=Batillaria attramentaria TaxID=370345 RepID=A0ABD0LP68_9CAEN